MNLASLLCELGELDEAITIYRSGAARLSAILGASHAASLRAQSLLGLALYRAGELDKAQFFLVSALKFDKGDADVLVQIGNLHVRKDDYLLAARAFQYALQQSPRHAAALEGMGLLYFKVGNDAEARKHLESALESGARLWRSHNALGVIADRQENFDRAQSHYDTALEIQPLADAVLINRGYSKYLNKNYLCRLFNLFTIDSHLCL